MLEDVYPAILPSVPLFDLDVLSTTCAFLKEYPDLLSFSLTCSALRPFAIRSMLRNRPVVLNTSTAVCKFHAFVFADAPSRLPHIIALAIDVARYGTEPPTSGEPFNSLLAILRGACSLRSLVLWFHGDRAGWSLGYIGDRRIAAAVSASTTLRELAVRGRDEWVDWANALPSTLKTFTMEYINPAGSQEWTPASLTTDFAPVAAHLESLTIDETEIQLAGGPGSFSPSTAFLALRSISLCSMSDIPNLSTLLELFPNLDGTLRLFLKRTLDEDTQEQRIALLEAHRRHFEVQEGRGWKQLKRFVTDVGMLFALNLRCKIAMMMIHSCSPLTAPFLVTCLRRNPPMRLSLQLDLSPGIEEFRYMIPLEVATTLTHLTLCICYEDFYASATSDPSMLWNGFWYNNLLPTLMPLHGLTHLHLVLHGKTWSKENGPDADTFLYHLRSPHFNYAGLASVIVFALPSLQYCFIATSTAVHDMQDVISYTLEVKYEGFRISAIGSGGEHAGRELVRLPYDIVKTVIDEEDLGLSKFEKREMCWDDSEYEY